MKSFSLFILTILFQPSFSQDTLNGIVIDSISHKPIAFANISLNGELNTASYLDGKFKVTGVPDSTVSLTIVAIDYFSKKLQIKIPNDSITILLKPKPFDHPSNFIIKSKPTDSTFFENGKIRKIEYRDHNIKKYYSNGQLKYKSVYGSTRNWYKNGQLSSQSVLRNNHSRFNKNWFPNGQLKSLGTSFWGYNEDENRGEWVKKENIEFQGIWKIDKVESQKKLNVKISDALHSISLKFIENEMIELETNEALFNSLNKSYLNFFSKFKDATIVNYYIDGIWVLVLTSKNGTSLGLIKILNENRFEMFFNEHAPNELWGVHLVFAKN